MMTRLLVVRLFVQINFCALLTEPWNCGRTAVCSSLVLACACRIPEPDSALCFRADSKYAQKHITCKHLSCCWYINAL